MDFFLFILVNATLFLRPGEIIPELVGVPVYEYVIVACLVVALPSLFRLLTRPLDTQPITLCVFGILAAVVLSHLVALQVSEAGRTGWYFFKVVIYYLLFVSIVNTPARLRTFLFWLLCFCTAYTLITVLQYHEVLSLPNLHSGLLDIDLNRETGEQIVYTRLQASGIFQDPNELCVMLAAAVPLVLYRLTDPAASVLRLLWVGPLGLFLYAIYKTYSRGGLLALLGGLGILLIVRYGWRVAVALGAVGLPLVLVLIGGRQADMSAQSGTGQSRVQIWSDWMMDFRQHPLFGRGMELVPEGTSLQERRLIDGEFPRVAHNSFLHGFAELGFVGGMLFLGAVYIALWGLVRIASARTMILEPGMRRLHPFLTGSLAAYSVGLLSLSLNYMVPTYLMLGLAAAYLQVTPAWPPLPALRFNGRVVGRLAIASVGFLAFTYVFIRIFLRWA
jgi:O-antigen ligase